MPDPDVVIAKLDAARSGYNDARNAADIWRNGKVAGVNFTAAQRNAVIAQFTAGMKAGKDNIIEVELYISDLHFVC